MVMGQMGHGTQLNPGQNVEKYSIRKRIATGGREAEKNAIAY